MVATLERQVEHAFWFQPDVVQTLRQRLAAATHWRDGDPWPQQPLICHDGMGLTGPSVQLIARAQADNVPILITGHVPEGSLGEYATGSGAAEFIRLPTHPTRHENIAMVRACGADRVIGHSCPKRGLARAAATPAGATRSRPNRRLPAHVITCMRILVSNDDGMEAPGLAQLADAAGSLAEAVWVVAPNRKVSGGSHSVTLHRPFTLTQIGERRFQCSGTPADCMIAARNVVFAEQPLPDLVLSGINHGLNVAEDIALFRNNRHRP